MVIHDNLTDNLTEIGFLCKVHSLVSVSPRLCTRKTEYMSQFHYVLVVLLGVVWSFSSISFRRGSVNRRICSEGMACCIGLPLFEALRPLPCMSTAPMTPWPFFVVWPRVPVMTFKMSNSHSCVSGNSGPRHHGASNSRLVFAK